MSIRPSSPAIRPTPAAPAPAPPPRGWPSAEVCASFLLVLLDFHQRHHRPGPDALHRYLVRVARQHFDLDRAIVAMVGQVCDRLAVARKHSFGRDTDGAWNPAHHHIHAAVHAGPQPGVGLPYVRISAKAAGGRPLEALL